MKTKLKNPKSKLNDIVKNLILSFDVDSTFNASIYYVLTGLTPEQFNDFCSKIPLTDLKDTDLHSLRSVIVCLLVKLRIGLSHEVLPILFSFRSRRDIGRVLDGARQVLIKYFVRKHLGFSHISGKDVISNHTRPLVGKKKFG